VNIYIPTTPSPNSPPSRPGALARKMTCASAYAIAALTLLALSPAALAAWDLDQLMQNLAQHKSGRATFTEKKYIAVLEKPVESSGDLLYTAPDRLEKRTFKPKPESMVISGSELLVERGRQKHRVQLQNYPELAAFIDSIRGTLAGDLKALERNYQLSLDGTSERWTLQLLPLDEKMRAVVQRIQIAGSADEVRSVEISQADGDHSVMTIEKLATP
jgi:outer membrane lipoprotein-sorting protein